MSRKTQWVGRDAMNKANLIPRLLLSGVGTMVFLQGVAQAASPTTAERIRLLNERLNGQEAALQHQQATLSAQLETINEELNSIQSERSELATLTGRTPATPSTARTTGPTVVPGPQIQTTQAEPTNQPSQTEATSEQAASTQREQAQESRKEQTNLVLQTNSSLSQSGGVLTPKGTLVVEPSLQYSYYNTNQVNVNGFTIVPGITFGNVNINKVYEDLLTEQLTLRYGLTNRSDIYIRVPFDTGYSTTITSPVLVGQTVGPIAVSAHAFNLGDIQLGGSYQLNNGSDTMPAFVANLNFKTATGTSPFSVPIFTSSSPEGIYLQGVDKKLPTGTGFYQLQPSLTVLYPTSPVILFANLKYVYNFARTVHVQNVAGGAATSARLQPGNGFGLAFGMGFSLNDRTSFSIGYEEDQYFNEMQNGQGIKGTAYDAGAFDFGLGYQATQHINANVGVTIGVGPNSPAAEIVVRFPISMNIF